MIDHVERRFLSFFLAMMLIVCMLPMDALAAQIFSETVLDGKVKVYGDGNTTVASGNLANGVITATATTTAKCNGKSYTYTSQSQTIEVSNNTAAETISLTFKYEASGLGTLTIDGVNKTATPNGEVKKTLAPGEKVTFVLTSPASGKDDKGNSATLVLKDFALADPNARTVVIKSGTNGTVSVAGTAISADKTVQTTYTDGVAVSAAPAPNYEFVAWVDAEGNVHSTTAADTINPEKNLTINAVFAQKNSAAYWLAGGKIHTDLTAAITAAQAGNKLVVLLNNGTISGNHEIPSDVTVLIPFDDVHTVSGADPITEPIPDYGPDGTTPSNQNHFIPYVYRKLTMAANAQLTVNGKLEVAAKHFASHGGKNFGSRPSSGYGQIEMGNNSKIIVNPNATMYVWGFITGSGSVLAESGGTIYEKFQLTDYPGGTLSGFLTSGLNAAGKKVFPFNQYFIQNVEVRETLKAGAFLIGHIGVYAEEVQEEPVDFLSNSDIAMFRLTSGSVTKYYDAATDRLVLEIDGDCSLNSVSLELGGDTYDTSQFTLPINHNITINVKKDAEITLNQDVMLLPGAEVNLEEGAEGMLASGKKLVLADAASWGPYCFGATMRPLTYVGARAGTPVSRNLTDAKLNVDGTLNLEGGLYSAAAQVVSVGETGTINFISAAPTSETGVNQSSAVSGSEIMALLGDASKLPTLKFNPATLANGDGTTVATKDFADGTEYGYCAEEDKWVELFDLSFDANGGAGEMDSMKVHSCETCRFPLPDVTFTAPEGMQFAGWNTVATPTTENPGTAYGDKYELYDFPGDITLYAQWEDIPTGMRGDIDKNEVVDINDFVLLAQHIGEVQEITDSVAMTNADVNGDEVIDINDFVKLAQYIGEVIDDLN